LTEKSSRFYVAKSGARALLTRKTIRHPPPNKGSTQRASTGYGLGEARGDGLSTAFGGWAGLEIGYSATGDNLAVSAGAGGAGTSNVGSGDVVAPLRGLDPGVCRC
jgi:hypothetical protein